MSHDPAMSGERQTALLVVRAWIEGSPETGFRARVTTSLDLDTREQTITAAGSVDAVMAAVRRWLDEFTAADQHTADPRRTDPGDADADPLASG